MSVRWTRVQSGPTLQLQIESVAATVDQLRCLGMDTVEVDDKTYVSIYQVANAIQSAVSQREHGVFGVDRDAPLDAFKEVRIGRSENG